MDNHASFELVLDLIEEECIEFLLARAKGRRFGPDSRDPDKPESLTNHQQQMFEILDVNALISKLIRRGFDPDLYPGEAERHTTRKIEKVKRYHPSLARFF